MVPLFWYLISGTGEGGVNINNETCDVVVVVVVISNVVVVVVAVVAVE